MRPRRMVAGVGRGGVAVRCGAVRPVCGTGGSERETVQSVPHTAPPVGIALSVAVKSQPESPAVPSGPFRPLLLL